jgi:hypothetical protein
MELKNKATEIEQIIKNILYIDEKSTTDILKNKILLLENNKNKLQHITPIIEDYINSLKSIILFLIKLYNKEEITNSNITEINNSINILNNYKTETIIYINSELQNILNDLDKKPISVNPPPPVQPEPQPPVIPAEEEIKLVNSINDILSLIIKTINSITNKVNYIDTSNRKLNILKANYINTFKEFNKQINSIKKILETNPKNKKNILNKLIIISNNVFIKYFKLVHEYYNIIDKSIFESVLINIINIFNNLLNKLNKYYRSPSIYNPTKDEINILLNNTYELFKFIDFSINIKNEDLINNELIIRNNITNTSSIINKYIKLQKGGRKTKKIKKNKKTKKTKKIKKTKKYKI